jgi:carbonic anhydrase
VHHQIASVLQLQQLHLERSLGNLCLGNGHAAPRSDDHKSTMFEQLNIAVRHIHCDVIRVLQHVGTGSIELLMLTNTRTLSPAYIEQAIAQLLHKKCGSIVHIHTIIAVQRMHCTAHTACHSVVIRSTS